MQSSQSTTGAAGSCLSASREHRPRSFGRLAFAHVVDEDTPHHLRRDTEKLRAVLPRHTILTYKADVRLVHQRRGLKRVVRPLAP